MGRKTLRACISLFLPEKLLKAVPFVSDSVYCTRDTSWERVSAAEAVTSLRPVSRWRLLLPKYLDRNFCMFQAA